MGNFPKSKVPARIQAGVTAETYANMLKHPQCSRLGKSDFPGCCRVDENGAYIPCEPVTDGGYAIELDHIVPRAKGGMNSLDNLQWLCACENRSKYTRADARYSGQLYFDSEIDPAKLREHQLLLGYNRAVSMYRDLFVSPERILSRFMLLAWLVGAGKTVGMASILFGINHVRKTLNGGSARRIKRVLWLVHQRSLVVSLANELRSELTSYGIAQTAPKVIEVENAAQWGYIGDIVVACPQSLWDTDNNSLTDHRRAEILSEFDAIVVDEAQFGVDRYLQLSMLAPQAFKFAITATPMDSEGRLFSEIDDAGQWFALYSCFGYEQGYDAGFYKQIVPFDEGFGNQYQEERGGLAQVRQGDTVDNEDDTKVANNAARVHAMIGRARSIALARSSQTNFDHQIMVRAGSILHAKGIIKALDSDGDACGVWSGAPGPHLGDKNHPWMLTKSNSGRIPRKGKRIVVTIDIGQFGINNPYCSIIVWVEPNMSMIEIIQRIGRAIRRVAGQDNSPVILIWDGVDEGMKDRIRKAVDYILDFEQRMLSFVSLAHINGDPTLADVTPAEARVKPDDRLRIAATVGQYIASGLGEVEAAKVAIEHLAAVNKWTPEYQARAANYAEVLQSDEGRQKALCMPSIFEPTRLVIREEPVTDYSPARLLANVENGLLQPRLFADARDALKGEIEKKNQLILHMLETEMREIDERNRNLEALTFYHPGVIVGTIKSDKPLPFKTIQQQFMAEMLSAIPSPLVKSAIGPLSVTMRACLRDYYGFAFKEEVYQSFKKPLADALMRDDEQRRILAKARFMFMQRHPELVPGLASRFRHELVGASADAA